MLHPALRRRWRTARTLAAATALAATACDLLPQEDPRDAGAKILHSAPVTDVAFSPAGDVLATASEDDTVRLLDAAHLASGAGGSSTIIEPIELPASPLLGCGGGVGAIAFSPDGQRIAIGTRDLALAPVVSVRSLQTGDSLAELAGAAGRIRGLAYAPDGAAIAAGGGYDFEAGALAVWPGDAAPAEPAQLGGDALGPVHDVAFSPDGALIAAAFGDGAVRLYAAADLGLVRELRADGSLPLAVAFSPDGALLATAGDDGGVGFDGHGAVVRLWRAGDGALVRSYDLGGQVVRALAIAPDGAAFAAAGDAHVIRIVRIETGEPLAELDGHTDTVRALAFSPDGALLASGADDQFVRLWDVDDLIGEPPGDAGPGDGGTDGGAGDAGADAATDPGPDGGV